MNLINIISLIFFLSASTGNPGQIKFEKTYLDAKQKARQANQHTFIYFEESNNASSEWIETNLFNDERIKGKLNDRYVNVKMNIKDFDAGILMKRFDLTKAPSFLILSPDGKLIGSANHGMTVQKFLEWISFYENTSNQGKTSNFQDREFNQMALKSSSTNAANENIRKENAEASVLTKELNPNESQNDDITPPSKKSNSDEKLVNKNEQHKSTTIPKVEKQDPKKEIQEEIKTGSSFVQAGVFGSEANAIALQNKINQSKITKSKIDQIMSNGKTVYKVIIPDLTDPSVAQDIVERLKTISVNAIVK